MAIFLPNLEKKRVARGIFLKQMLDKAENCVEHNGDAYPLGKLPILEEIPGKIGHNGEWQGNEEYHWTNFHIIELLIVIQS